MTRRTNPLTQNTVNTARVWVDQAADAYKQGLADGGDAERARITALMREGFERLDNETQAVLAAMFVRWAAAITDDPGILREIAELIGDDT